VAEKKRKKLVSSSMEQAKGGGRMGKGETKEEKMEEKKKEMEETRKGRKRRSRRQGKRRERKRERVTSTCAGISIVEVNT